MDLARPQVVNKIDPLTHRDAIIIPRGSMIYFHTSK